MRTILASVAATFSFSLASLGCVGAIELPEGEAQAPDSERLDDALLATRAYASVDDGIGRSVRALELGSPERELPVEGTGSLSRTTELSYVAGFSALEDVGSFLEDLVSASFPPAHELSFTLCEPTLCETRIQYHELYATEVALPVFERGSRAPVEFAMTLRGRRRFVTAPAGQLEPSRRTPGTLGAFRFEVGRERVPEVVKVELPTVRRPLPSAGAPTEPVTIRNLKLVVRGSEVDGWSNRMLDTGSTQLDEELTLHALDINGRELFHVTMHAVALVKAVELPLVDGARTASFEIACDDVSLVWPR